MYDPDGDRPRRILVIYRDRALLSALERPKLLGPAASACVEVAPKSRLAADGAPLGERSVVRPAPTSASPREAWSLAAAAADRLARASGAAVGALVCHLDDLDALLPFLAAIDDVKLLWHPSDVVDAVVEGSLLRLEGSAAGRAIGPYPVYFAASGRTPSAGDWLRAVRCPVLQMFADSGRRRRRSVDIAYGWDDSTRPTAPMVRAPVALRLVPHG